MILRMRHTPPEIKCGSFVRELRGERGWGQAELAQRAGMEQPAVSRIERDVVSPSLDTLHRLFGAMGMTFALEPVRVQDRVPGGGNQTIAELRSDFRDLTAEERLAQAAHLSEVTTELAAGAQI
jgi:transcriptional regulator with XRE-family HTH domain